jgi:hypothetical protein
MASSSQGLRTVLQLVLAIVIAGLAYLLYTSITEPYEAVERRREITQMTRDRMNQVRSAIGVYQRANDRYPGSLDSLVMYIKSDSAMMAGRDSLFGPGFEPDSLTFSPRTGSMFEYAVNDTGRVVIYMLKDPDSDDRIGALTPDITLLNAANWE